MIPPAAAAAAARMAVGVEAAAMADGWMGEYAPHALAVLVAVLMALVVLAIFGARKGRSRRDAVLMLGPMGGGKTALLLAMQRTEPLPATVTSMAPNEAAIRVAEGKEVPCVDVPGHPRLHALVQAHAPRAYVVVFVIDAADFASRARDVAEALAEALDVAEAQRAPLVVACNKSDRAVASPPSYVKTRLEKELGAVRDAKAQGDGLSAAGEREGARQRRGASASSAGGKFAFDGCGVPVSFVATSARESQVEALLAALAARR